MWTGEDILNRCETLIGLVGDIPLVLLLPDMKMTEHSNSTVEAMAQVVNRILQKPARRNAISGEQEAKENPEVAVSKGLGEAQSTGPEESASS